MTKAIVIATRLGRHDWVANCLASLDTPHQVIVATEYSYELGKLRWLMEHTTLEEILFLQDTCEVKDNSFIDEVFDYPGSVSLSRNMADIPFFMYLGKYRRPALLTTGFPEVNSKVDAIVQEERWTERYALNDDYINLWDDFTDTNNFREFNGRLNMVLENDYLVKYKGTWALSMVKDGE